MSSSLAFDPDSMLQQRDIPKLEWVEFTMMGKGAAKYYRDLIVFQTKFPLIPPIVDSMILPSGVLCALDIADRSIEIVRTASPLWVSAHGNNGNQLHYANVRPDIALWYYWDGMQGKIQTLNAISYLFKMLVRWR
jgi:hypothetical protein